ncbi:o-succinylbenzoate synthase [Phormidesmis priestleyi]
MKFEFRCYRRPFRQALQTSHGLWRVREGIILRLEAETVSFGEIAPLEWFGSESFDQALDFCNQLAGEVDAEMISRIPDRLPACQFGFESLISERSVVSVNRSAIAALLPTGKKALETWQNLWQQGHQTFKWKIGVAPISEELRIFGQLIQNLPSKALLRLDANGGLSYLEAEKWLQTCDSTHIEFLEQPLSIHQFDAMLELSQKYDTPLAIDESIATLNQLKDCYQKGWRGIFVIKPAIAGSPSRLRQFCQEHSIDAVFSSVFETAIGRQAGLTLAAELSSKNRAFGYGTEYWFDSLMEESDRLWQLL